MGERVRRIGSVLATRRRVPAGADTLYRQARTPQGAARRERPSWCASAGPLPTPQTIRTHMNPQTTSPSATVPQPAGSPHFPRPSRPSCGATGDSCPGACWRRAGRPASDVLRLARGIGFPLPPRVTTAAWLARGYCTLIRNNWHLLPYDSSCAPRLDGRQIDFVLREDDFLLVKLGTHRPAAAPVRYAPLTPEQQRQTARLRADVEPHFPRRRRRARRAAVCVPARVRRRGPSPRAPRTAPLDLRLAYSYCGRLRRRLAAPGERPVPRRAPGAVRRHLGVNAVWPCRACSTRWRLGPDARPLRPAGRRASRTCARLAERRPLRHRRLSLLERAGAAARAAFAHASRTGDHRLPADQGLANLCTSLPAVQRLPARLAEQCSAKCPGLAGLFTITMSENLTHCHSRGTATSARDARSAGRPR